MTWTLTIPGELWTVNAERNRHWAWRSTRAKQWRSDTCWLAKAAHVPALTRARIDVQVEQAKGRLADVEAHSPAVKAAIDGIIDAGVLPDDSGEYLASVVFHAPTRSPDKIGRLILTISEADTD